MDTACRFFAECDENSIHVLDFGVRGEKREMTVVHSKRRVFVLKDRDDKGPFPEMRKVTFFSTFVVDCTPGRQMC